MTTIRKRAPLYAVSIWDHETRQFEREATTFNLWDLRKIIRRLRSDGYSSVSILIERED